MTGKPTARISRTGAGPQRRSAGGRSVGADKTQPQGPGSIRTIEADRPRVLGRPRSPRSRVRFHWFGAQAQRPQGVLGAHACRGEWFNRGCAQSYSAAGPDNRPVGRTRTAPEIRCSQRACNALGQERKHHSRAHHVGLPALAAGPEPPGTGAGPGPASGSPAALEAAG